MFIVGVNGMSVTGEVRHAETNCKGAFSLRAHRWCVCACACVYVFECVWMCVDVGVYVVCVRVRSVCVCSRGVCVCVYV